MYRQTKLQDQILSSPKAPSILTVLGEQLVPHFSGALYWPAQQTLIVSDLHFEKATSFGPQGRLLPPYDTRETLTRLRRVMQHFSPLRVISLGDAFHDINAEARLDAADREQLEDLTRTADWYWVLGNHDPRPPSGLGGVAASSFEFGPLIFRHEPSPAPASGELAGHLHPCAAVRARGRRLRRRCIVSDGSRAILPSFGAFTGGLNVLDEAYRDLFAGLEFHAWMMGSDDVYPVAARRLIADPW